MTCIANVSLDARVRHLLAQHRQDQAWLAAPEDPAGHMLILSRFTELPPPPRPAYPGEVWLAVKVADIRTAIEAVEAAGGAVLRTPEDRPEHCVRAAVVGDPEGHIIEVVGTLRQS